jgi:hypothetical protein
MIDFKKRLPYDHPLNVAKRCRQEMRGWAMWWRRSTKYARPDRGTDFILKGAITMRNSALAMEAQARRHEN